MFIPLVKTPPLRRNNILCTQVEKRTYCCCCCCSKRRRPAYYVGKLCRALRLYPPNFKMGFMQSCVCVTATQHYQAFCIYFFKAAKGTRSDALSDASTFIIAGIQDLFFIFFLPASYIDVCVCVCVMPYRVIGCTTTYIYNVKSNKLPLRWIGAERKPQC